MKTCFFLPTLLVILLLNDLRAGLPVEEDGPQLSYVQSLTQLTSKIQGDQSLSQQHLAKIRAMEEGSKTVSQAMAQMSSLVKHGQLLSSDANGQTDVAATSGLSYNGSSFSGGNYQFIDNLMGQNGPIALDRILPTTLIPVSGGLLEQAQQSVANFASSASSSLINATAAAILGAMPPSALQNGGGVASQLVTQFLQNQSSGQSGMMGDGVFLRPYSGSVDDAYQALVENGTSAQEVQFFADSTMGGGGYQAILGPTNNPSLSMVNMDNLLSAGASQAVQSYLQNNSGGGSNPYQGYANQLLSQLPNLVSQAAPGTFLVPSSQQVSSAPQLPMISGGNTFPSLFSGYAAANPTPTLSSATPFGIPAPSEEQTNAQGVVVVTPPAAEAQAYESRISDSDQRLTVIVQELKTEQQAQQYNQQIVQSLQSIEEQAQGIQQSLNTGPLNSIPELTLLIRDLQGDMEARQQVANALTLSIASLEQQLHTELGNRSQIVSQEKKTQSAQAMSRWRSALEGNPSA